MKKVHLSPVTPLLVSFSLALGILVSDVRGYKFLTSAHAQEVNPCGTLEGDATLFTGTMTVEDGLILSGITVRNINVNGNILEEASIAGNVQITSATVVGATGIIYAEGEFAAEPNGVLVGSGRPCLNGVLVGSNGVLVGSGSPSPNGVLVGSGVPSPNGVLVGSGSPSPNGVLVGSGSPSPNGVLVGSNGVLVGSGSPSPNGVLVGSNGVLVGSGSGTAIGGTLTGDNLVVINGVITGQNLLLSGATFDDGSISGAITSISITPAN